MSTTSQILKYQVKTCWSPIHWAGVAFALVFPVVFAPPDLPGRISTGAYVLETTQVFLPLLGVTAMSGLISAEYEGRTSETLLSTRFSRTRLLLMRYSLALLYAATLSALVFAVYLARGQMTASEARAGLLSAAIPAVYLGTLGLVAGLVAGSTAVALLVPSGYWLMEVFTKGRYTRRLYLFSYGDHRFDWLFGKMMLLAAALALLALGISVFETRRA